MAFKFYCIDENNEKKYLSPEPQELKYAENDFKNWGIKKGMVSLVNPIRTVDVYFEAV